MQLFNWLMILVCTLWLVGCGSKQPDAHKGAAAAAETASGNLSAEQVAERSRGDIDCPAPVTTPPRSGHAPVDDVLGVRPGMGYDEAVNTVLCTHKLLVVTTDDSRGFRMQTYGQKLRQGFSARFAQPRIQKTSRQILREMENDAIARGTNARRQDMQPGQAKWYVSTMGLPGKERVINVAREERFETGRNPPMASVEQALIKKYGQPTRTQKSSGHIYLTWSYDPQGRPVTESAPLYNQCTGTADPDDGVNLSPDCGIVVSALVAPRRDNPDLSEYMQVGVVDQAGGYDRITRTEQALQQADAQRRAKQVEDAAKNSTAPQL